MLDSLLNNPEPIIFVRILIEECGIPLLISSGTLLLYLGYKAPLEPANFLAIAFLSSLATLIGASFLYFISKHFGRFLLYKYQNILKHVHITPRTIRQLEIAMDNYGVWFIVIARFTPGARILSTIAAGMLGMPYKKFIATAVPTSFVWALAYLCVGHFLGEAYTDLLYSVMNNKLAMLAAFVLFIGLFLLLGKTLKPKIFPPLSEDDL